MHIYVSHRAHKATYNEETPVRIPFGHFGGKGHLRIAKLPTGTYLVNNSFGCSLSRGLDLQLGAFSTIEERLP